MTGAGKSWTSRRIIEQLAKKNYPIVIFDPHGDYTGLSDVGGLNVERYYAQFPVFEEDSDTIAEIVGSLAYPLSDTMLTMFPDIVQAAKSFYVDDSDELRERTEWLSGLLNRTSISKYGLRKDMWLISSLAEAGEMILRDSDNETGRHQLQEWGWEGFSNYSGNDKRTLEAIKKRTRRAANALQRMEKTNQKVALSANPLPQNRTQIVEYGKISVVSLAGYPSDFQATIYSLIANEIFDARVQEKLNLPVLLVLEEGHNFVPARATTNAEQTSVATTRQIAQEGRKFGVGIVLISQRPSRLDETTLAMCNSFIIMRMVNPADQNFVRKVIESLGEDEAKLLPDLDKGEAVLSGQLINFPVLVKMKPPQSQGEREETDAFVALEEAHKQETSKRK